jgi:glycosyltransferase involved in cell wall biosynthesis
MTYYRRRMTRKVTWLLPILNAMPYLRGALQSIADQTYTDAEVLAWDNGSNDGSVEELEAWIPSRIPGRVVTGRPPSVGGSLRDMMLAVDTPLCARMDGDDVSLPRRLELQVEFLEAHPEIAVVGTQPVPIDAEGRTTTETMVPFPESHEKITLSLLCRNPLCHPSLLLRRRAVLDSGNYRDIPNVEDYDLWFRMASNGHRFHNLPQALLKHRIYDASVSERSRLSGRQRARIDACVVENAPLLYGCSRETVRKFRERAHRFGAVQIVAFLWRFARANEQDPLDLLFDPAVAFGWPNLVAANDYGSRALLKLGRALARARS